MKQLLPPVLFVIFILVMTAINWVLAPSHLVYYPYNLIGLLFVSMGLMLAITGKKLFKKLNTNIMTFDEPTKLVTQGIYQYTRNPMYLGFAIAMLGFAILNGGTLSSLVLTLIFILVTDRWYIQYEEQMMRIKFGQDYEIYCSNVRRWF